MRLLLPTHRLCTISRLRTTITATPTSVTHITTPWLPPPIPLLANRRRSQIIPFILSRGPQHYTTMAQPEVQSPLSSNNPTTSEITPDSLSRTLKEKLDATHTSIVDMSGGCGSAFEAIIVSPQFSKKNTLARHRLVNAALKEEIAAIHAWSPKCFSPEEWEVKQSR